jgi:hypothetical protein
MEIDTPPRSAPPVKQSCFATVEGRKAPPSKEKQAAPPLKMRRAATVTGAAVLKNCTPKPDDFYQHVPLLESRLESKDMIRRISVETVF